MSCTNCNFATGDSDCVRCCKCGLELHKSCADWKGSGSGKIALCNKCKTLEIELPIEYVPPEPGTSHEGTSHCGGLDRELTCILFPGIVKNVDKAIHCLGGIKGISQVACQPQKKRLGLSFQPDNPFVKKMYADFKKTSGVLLKVKVKKIKENGQVRRKVMSTDVVGKVNKMYKFDSMCDFQYLPIYREASGEPLQCLLDKIIPSGKDDMDFIIGESPLYIVPPGFTRFDRPINYSYTDKRYPDRGNTPEADTEFHNKTRAERGLPQGHWLYFSYTADIPDKPDEFYIKNRDAKFDQKVVLRSEYDTVQKCFDERPIWSLNMLRFKTKLRVSSMKIIVPCLAIYMKDGPWKALWVKYGYDPRKEPASRIYQTFDFRLRHEAGVYSMVMTREQVVHYKSTDRVRVMKRKFRSPPPPSEDVSEGAVLFRPGIVPAQRQIFYQLCDVHLPEIQSLLEAEPTRECHKKHGWFAPHVIETCRNILFKEVKESLLASHSTDIKFDVADDAGSSDEDSQASGDEITNSLDDTMQ